jgi:hypothetical protein
MRRDSPDCYNEAPDKLLTVVQGSNAQTPRKVLESFAGEF